MTSVFMDKLNLKLVPILMIIFAIMARLLPHPANFAPITAMALFGGVYLPKKYAFLLPFGALIISDYFLGFYGLEMVWVYGSFFISGLIGLYIRKRKRKNILTIVSGTLLASLLFFLITNFGVWALPYSWYSKDLGGLIQSYIAGIPFFRGTILGDLFYTGVFFGGYELALNLGKKYLPAKLFNRAF